MNKWTKYTITFVLALVALVTVWDFTAIYNGGKEASISHQIIVWSYEYPSVTFLVGFVCGHLFWRMKEVRLKK